jgi:hypothetical protein
VGEERELRAERDVVRRLIGRLRVAPAVGGFNEVLRRRRRVARHELRPVLERRLRDEAGGEGTVRDVLGLRLAQEAAGHGHAGDGFEAGEGDFRRGCDRGEGDGFIVGGNVVEDVEVQKPAEAGEGLVLEKVSFIRETIKDRESQ